VSHVTLSDSGASLMVVAYIAVLGLWAWTRGASRQSATTL
jgi:hypothetical protein